MWIVEIHEHNQKTDNYDQVRFLDYDSAEDYFEAERSSDFDYGNHYRITSLFERQEL